MAAARRGEGAASQIGNRVSSEVGAGPMPGPGHERIRKRDVKGAGAGAGAGVSRDPPPPKRLLFSKSPVMGDCMQRNDSTFVNIVGYH